MNKLRAVLESLFMTPTLKKLVGHIAFGLSMYACIHLSRFLAHLSRRLTGELIG